MLRSGFEVGAHTIIRRQITRRSFMVRRVWEGARGILLLVLGAWLGGFRNVLLWFFTTDYWDVRLHNTQRTGLPIRINELPEVCASTPFNYHASSTPRKAQRFLQVR